MNFQELTQDKRFLPFKSVTPEIVSRLEHLKEIASEIPVSDPENALILLSVVPNEGDGPFALQLKHGWTVSGPLHLTSEPFTNKVTVNRITVREIESVKEIITSKSLLKMFELDFSENASNDLPEELGHSQEDRRFLTKVYKGIRLTEGYYEIPLPFR